MKYCIKCRILTDTSINKCYICNGKVSSSYTVGADLKCDLTVNVPTVSSWHFRITIVDDHHFWIEDLESTNGTYVNHVRITATMVSTNDIIHLGSYQWNVGQLIKIVQSKQKITSQKQPVTSNDEVVRYVRCVCGSVTKSGTHCECGRVL